MIRGGRNFGLALGLAFLLWGCEDPGIIGIDADADNLSFSTNYESFTLPMRLIQRDSIASMNTGTILVGEFEDLLFGRVRAQAYAQASLTGIPLIPSQSTYDSLVLQLEYSYVHGQEITDEHTLNVHRLRQDLSSEEVYYTFDRHVYQVAPLGTTTFEYVLEEPTTGQAGQEVKLDTTLTMRLSDTFGQEMFDKMLDPEDTTFMSDAAFQAYLQGLAFLPGDNNPTVTGFNMFSQSTTLTLWYSFEGDAASIPFTLSLGPHYHTIEVDRSGTSLASIGDQTYTEFDADDGLIYLQSLTGIIPKIDFSPFTDWSETLQQDSTALLFQNATLTLGSVETIAPNRVPPTEIIFYYTDSTNRFQGDEDTGAIRAIQEDNPLIDPAGSFLPASFDFIEDNDVVEDSYSDLITSYIQALHDGDVTVDQVLAHPTPQSNAGTLDRFTLNPLNIKLEVYYTTTREAGG